VALRRDRSARQPAVAVRAGLAASGAAVLRVAIPLVDLERGTLERALPRLEAVIAWLERPRIEQCAEEGVAIHYVAPGLAMVTRLGLCLVRSIGSPRASRDTGPTFRWAIFAWCPAPSPD
jgi:hypothetical protein